MKLSPGTIVADVQFAFEQEVAKWRFEKTNELWMVYRAGFPHGGCPPFDHDRGCFVGEERIEIHQHRTYEQATKIITTAGWKAAVNALEESFALVKRRRPRPSHQKGQHARKAKTVGRNGEQRAGKER